MESEQAYIDAINADPEDRTLQLVYAEWLDEMGSPLAEAWRALIEAEYQPKQEHDGAWAWVYPFAPVDERGPRSFWRYLTFFHAMQAAAAGWIRCYREPEFSMRDYSKMYMGEHEAFVGDELAMQEMGALPSRKPKENANLLQ